MRTFIVEVKENSKAVFVETLLNELNGVVVKEQKIKIAAKKNGKVAASKKKDNLFSNSFGMWKDADITLKSIRYKAWGKKI